MKTKSINIIFQLSVIAISSYFIYDELFNKKDFINFITSNELLSYFLKNWYFLIIAFLFSFFNWYLESVKWQLLIKKREPLSAANSLKSILAGVSLSVFSPNRIGELGGKVLFLKKAGRIEAIFIAAIGSLSQLLITMIAGIIALILFFFIFNEFNLSLFSEITITVLGSLSISLMTYLFFKPVLIYKFFKKTGMHKISQYLKVFNEYSKSELLLVLCISGFRYFTFSSQFYLLLLFFDVHTPFIHSMIMISLVYLSFSIIPTFAFSEIGVKGSAAIFFFGFITSNSPAVFSSSFLLWIINLAIPSLIGYFFIFRLKLIRNGNS